MENYRVQYICMLCGDKTKVEGESLHINTVKLVEVICPYCRDKLRAAAGITFQGIDVGGHTRGLWRRNGS